jgi:hypothetical protein
LSSVDIEYKKRKLKIHYELIVTMKDTDFTVSDHTETTKFLQAKLEQLINDYLSNENTIEMIDMQIDRLKYL